MEVQARAWVFKRLKVIFTSFKMHFVAAMSEGTRQVSSTQRTIRLNGFDMLIMNQLLDIYVDADLLIHRPTDGFISTLGIQRELGEAISEQATEAELTRIYAKIETDNMQMNREFLQQAIDARVGYRQDVMPEGLGRLPDFLNAPSDMIDREGGHKSLQPEIQNPPPMRPEPWVAALMSERAGKFGYVVYRLSYDEGPEDWAAFLRRFKDGLNSGWEGVVGAAAIRDREILHWIDGKTENIPEGDVRAARV